VAAFAFAQSVHYAAWLRLVPDGERDSERPVGYRRSLALFRADFPPAAGRALLIACIALPLAALASVHAAHAAYFRLSAFHGYLELAALAALALA
jgi:hypothetical protein